jgi:Ca2+/H+ antiporter
MAGLGLHKTYQKVMSANGPAQMLTYAFWGVLMAGMFRGICDACFPDHLLLLWGAVSATVVPVTIWFSREWLRNILLIDVVISAYILVVFLMHEPHAVEFVYYSMTANGMTAAESSQPHSLSDWFHASALIWMTLHAIYLADLTNRQILEKRRFSDDI